MYEIFLIQVIKLTYVVRTCKKMYVRITRSIKNVCENHVL
jgi:hypothetical protein